MFALLGLDNPLQGVMPWLTANLVLGLIVLALVAFVIGLAAVRGWLPFVVTWFVAARTAIIVGLALTVIFLIWNRVWDNPRVSALAQAAGQQAERARWQDQYTSLWKQLEDERAKNQAEINAQARSYAESKDRDAARLAQLEETLSGLGSVVAGTNDLVANMKGTDDGKSKMGKACVPVPTPRPSLSGRVLRDLDAIGR